MLISGVSSAMSCLGMWTHRLCAANWDTLQWEQGHMVALCGVTALHQSGSALYSVKDLKAALWTVQGVNGEILVTVSSSKMSVWFVKQVSMSCGRAGRTIRLIGN